ncbi:hypothetical protein RchiOBHm_Chr7g0242151 [Rosa chinensis]|uniref:Uncharacterized protein n=1 Tax=Rosa chinensis TaxID=74649 RepID=A0A2P6PIE8_ROSCH|nr:hypothetical protein RchiOBHm_Chr7g0242151 [Rosa chinensis]
MFESKRSPVEIIELGQILVALALCWGKWWLGICYCNIIYEKFTFIELSMMDSYVILSQYPIKLLSLLKK